MELDFSPHQSPTGVPLLLSPRHMHGSHLEGFPSIKQIRRSLSRSPSKPQKYALFTARATSMNPGLHSTAPGFARTQSATSASELVSRQKYLVKRGAQQRLATRRTSPNSPLRRALSDNTNYANTSPRSLGHVSVENKDIVEQENCTTTRIPHISSEGGRDDPIKIDFLKPDKLLQPVLREHVPAMKSSPLKRSDGVMNLEAASFGSPRIKRRSLHGASLGNDFNVFDHGADAPSHDAVDSPERREKDFRGINSSTWPSPAANSPHRHPFSLRRSTLQQRAGPTRQRQPLENARETIPSPAATRTRSRISLDSTLPLRGLETDSPLRRPTFDDAPRILQPAAQRPYQSAPKPHPLSHALTPSSSSSSMNGDPDADELQHGPSSANPNPATNLQAKYFSKSLPIGALRYEAPDTEKGSDLSDDSFATPNAYKMAKPLPQAFMSTGLISKRNRNLDMAPTSLFSSTNMPDTPSKKATHIQITSPAPSASALGKLVQPLHEFGSPSTPFNARMSKALPETFGKGASIFGSRVGAPQLTRRGSFISVDGDDLTTSPTHGLESRASSGELPPTPTKSNSATTSRPQSKGKSNSLRSSLFGRRTSLGPDTFAFPGCEDEPCGSENDGKHLLSYQPTPSENSEMQMESAHDVPTLPHITLTTFGTQGNKPDSDESLSNNTHSTTQRLRRATRCPPMLVIESSALTKSFSHTATNVIVPLEESDRQASPHTPQEAPEMYMPPDPSNLSISAERRPSTFLGSSNFSFPPATPTGPRDPSMGGSLGQTHASSSYFSNDVDTSLTSRFSSVATSGIGEFSQVYRVEQPLNESTATRSQRALTRNVWAVKKSRKPYTGHKDRQRKMREVQILKKLRGHEHVIELVDDWESKNHLYIQTEFCENGNLKDFLTSTGFKGRLDDFRIWKILLELSQGVKSIHDAGFIHLDLKPANVFIDWEGVLKIGDFGMASSWPAPEGLDGEGDREYIGPEVLSGCFDKPADIFALGMIMLEIAGNIVLPDNGTSWQRLRAGDMSDLPSLTWSSDSSLVRDDSGDPVDMLYGSSEGTPQANEDEDDADDLSFLKPRVATRHSRVQDLVQPPNFMVDPTDFEALDRVVQWMITPSPDRRPAVAELLNTWGVQWVEKRRRAGATVYEGNWGPADDVLGQDIEMVDV